MTQTIELYACLAENLVLAGRLRRYPRRDGEAVTFEYSDAWLTLAGSFALEPHLPKVRGIFTPAKGALMFASMSDAAPDSWGRRLMQRAQRRAAEVSPAALRTLMEADYLLGVADQSRMGAIRYRYPETAEFQAPSKSGVPKLVALGKLLAQSQRILTNTETESDLLDMLAPGSSLGGARPKASVLDQHENLSIAKFPKDSDEYSVERWEYVAMRLAASAGVCVPDTELLSIQNCPVLISRRFDRRDDRRIAYISALTMLNLRDGDRASYLEIAEALREYGASAKHDAKELFRRMLFNILISNVDDHLRNHGFLYEPGRGWHLAPAFDLNPTPVDIKRRVLTTSITLDDATCSIENALSVAEYFGYSLIQAKLVAGEIAKVTAGWRSVAEISGASKNEIQRIASAFEHEDLKTALKFR